MAGGGNSGLKNRVLSTLVLAPVTLLIIYLGGLPFILLALAAMVVAMHEWVRMARLGGHFVRDCAVGAAYIAAAVIALIDLRLRHDGGLFLVTALLLCVWASDIGGYVAGKTIGGPKMCPSISPNKTWAGLGGAMLFPAFTLAAMVAMVGMMGLPVVYAFVAGMLFGVVGQAGDLMVSKFKRRVGVKDTGALIPGHGGLLDRIDSLLLVAPVFLLAYVLWL